MKKIFLGLIMFVSAVTFSQKIEEGDSQLNAGIGFTSGWGTPFYAGFDYGVSDDISVGAQLSYATTSKNFGFGDAIDGTWFGIGVNGNYHFNTVLDIPNEWDVYGGLTLAYNSFSWDYPDDFPDNVRTGTSSGVGLAGQIGARYYFSDKFGINLEFGGGNIASGGKIGISYRL